MTIPELPITPLDTETPGVRYVPPPIEAIPVITGVIAEAAKNLPPGAKGGVFGIYEVLPDGTRRVNGAIVQKFNDNLAVVGWIGKEWGRESGISYGGAVQWTW